MGKWPRWNRAILIATLAMAPLLIGDQALWGASSKPEPSPSPTTTASVEMEYREDLNRVVPLRQHFPIQVTNSRGDITIVGWSQDKIRIQARRSVHSADPTDAKRLLRAADFAVRTAEGRIEVIAEYGSGLTLEERLRERANPRTSMELTVYAPADLPLRIWATDGKVMLKDWRSTVEVRTRSGSVAVSGVRGDSVSILCPTCQMTVDSIRGSLRCMGGEGTINLRDVSGAQVYTESVSGPVLASNVEGDQLYVSKTGSIQVQDARGRIEFNLQQGAFNLVNGSGFLSGKTTSGHVNARMRAWTFADKALIETVSGDVSLILPSDLSAELDLWSREGAVKVEFPIRRSAGPLQGGIAGRDRAEKRSENQSLVPAAALGGNRQSGWVGAGGEVLRVFSEKGTILLQPSAR